MIRAVTFDAAGTLFRVAEPVGETYARSARRQGATVDPAEVEARFRRAFADAPPLAFPGLAGAALDEAERAWWRTIVEHALGAVLPAAAFREVYEHYASGAAWLLAADAAETLATLRARGLRLGVVSNFDGRLPRILAELGLAPFFDAVTWSSAAGAAKPDPAIFATALRALGTSDAETLHVGDDERCDVEGARRAGLAALRIDPSGSDATAIRRLGDLPGRL